MKTSQSNGHNGISSELLKLISNDFVDSITLTINQSLKSGIFPNQLKIYIRIDRSENHHKL